MGEKLGGAEGLQWSTWVLDVAEQMKTHVENFADSVEAARESNQSDAKRLDIMHDAVATMESRLVQHARRKSLGRRKVGTLVFFFRNFALVCNYPHIAIIAQMNASSLEEEMQGRYCAPAVDLFCQYFSKTMKKEIDLIIIRLFIYY